MWRVGGGLMAQKKHSGQPIVMGNALLLVGKLYGFEPIHSQSI
jgi:hypothetical protein